MTRDLSWDEFDDAFQRFVRSATSTRVYRWEGRDSYSIPADEPSLVAFREGLPRPERSVRTSPWLARIAGSTAAGKEWVRVRRVVEGDEYFEWELLAYVESQAAGERVVMFADAPGSEPPVDVWAFDGDDPSDRYLVVMHYADDGTVDRLEYDDDPTRVRNTLALVGGLANDSTPLNVYFARRRGVIGAA